jgi:hypothetical protein
MKLEDYLATSFGPENQKELDMFGYSLETLAQAAQYYMITKDIRKTKKKFASSKKLPKQLKTVQG